MRKALIALVFVVSACSPLTPGEVEDFRTSAQAKLNAVIALAQQAEVGVEYVCEIAPDSKECEILTDALTRLYAASVYIQSGIDAGSDVEDDLQAMYEVALKIARLAAAAKRSIA